eukprot:354339-Chlamydomonas_euryale.AAC.3
MSLPSPHESARCPALAPIRPCPPTPDGSRRSAAAVSQHSSRPSCLRRRRPKSARCPAPRSSRPQRQPWHRLGCPARRAAAPPAGP